MEVITLVITSRGPPCKPSSPLFFGLIPGVSSDELKNEQRKT